MLQVAANHDAGIGMGVVEVTELGFYVPLDRSFRRRSSQPNSWLSTGKKLNLTQQKQTTQEQNRTN